MQFVWLAAGASLGAVTRYSLYLACLKLPTSVILGTVLVNLLGSFLMGLAMPVMESWPQAVKIGLITGFLGALTTFSTFSLEVNQLMVAKQLFQAITMVMVSVAGGLTLCALGYRLSHWMFG